MTDFLAHHSTSEKGSTLKEKNLLPWSANYCFFKVEFFSEGDLTIILIDLPPQIVYQFF